MLSLSKNYGRLLLEWLNVEKGGHSCTVGGNVNWCCYYGNS